MTISEGNRERGISPTSLRSRTVGESAMPVNVICFLVGLREAHSCSGLRAKNLRFTNSRIGIIEIDLLQQFVIMDQRFVEL